MAGVETRVGQAAATHRRVAAVAAAAGAVLEGYAARPRSTTAERSIRELAERLRVAAGLLAPGWLGAPLDAVPASTPFATASWPELVRIGTAYPLDDTSFPVLVPLGHLALDADARDPRVARGLQALLLRLVAATRPGSLLVRGVDPAEVTFAPFAPLHDAGILSPPVTDRTGLCAVLTEAEEWVRAAGDHGCPTRTMLLVVATWPQATEPTELTRLSVLASEGPAAGLHLLLAGWPPLLLGEDATEPVAPGTVRTGPPLPHATRVTLRNPYAVVGHPPDGSFAAPVPAGHSASPGLNAQVYLDEPPSADMVTRVCRDVAVGAVQRAREALVDVLPDQPLWTYDAAAGMEVVVGRAGDTPVRLRLAPATPHWLIAGEPGSGKTTLLQQILYGLCGRYSPEQLHCYLLDFTGAGSFANFVPRPGDSSYLPHARAVGVDPRGDDAVAVLRGLVAELERRRAGPAGHAGESEPTGHAGESGPTGKVLPRLLCAVDEVGELAAAAGAAPLLASLAQHGGEVGIHLVLVGRSLPPPEVAGHCRVRVALPGGAEALDPANRAADDLTVGTAVVNTAAGLGGPSGVTRAHEQLVRFPDPGADPAGLVGLAGLRHRLWRTAGVSGGGR